MGFGDSLQRRGWIRLMLMMLLLLRVLEMSGSGMWRKNECIYFVEIY
jgi:hypothetical protein